MFRNVKQVKRTKYGVQQTIKAATMTMDMRSAFLLAFRNKWLLNCPLNEYVSDDDELIS